MSNRFDYNLTRHRYNLDDVALDDVPALIEMVRQHVGPDRRLRVICHCLGSVAFCMALFGQTVSGIASVVSNSVSLTPRISRWSRMKIAVAPFLLEYVARMDYVNPSWSRDSGLTIGKLISWFVSAAHRECDVPECHMVSFMWGSGKPAVYMHENMLDVTHRRGGDLFGGVAVNYHRHVRKMVRAGVAVKYETDRERYAALPDRYIDRASEIETPILLVTGGQNRVFGDSNVETYRRLNDEVSPGQHELHVFPGYGHQDVLMGGNCHRDTFPRMLAFLHQHSARHAAGS